MGEYEVTKSCQFSNSAFIGGRWEASHAVRMARGIQRARAAGGWGEQRGSRTEPSSIQATTQKKLSGVSRYAGDSSILYTTVYYGLYLSKIYMISVQYPQKYIRLVYNFPLPKLLPSCKIQAWYLRLKSHPTLCFVNLRQVEWVREGHKLAAIAEPEFSNSTFRFSAWYE